VECTHITHQLETFQMDLMDGLVELVGPHWLGGLIWMTPMEDLEELVGPHWLGELIWMAPMDDLEELFGPHL